MCLEYFVNGIAFPINAKTHVCIRCFTWTDLSSINSQCYPGKEAEESFILDVGGETEIGSFNDRHLTRNFAIWRLVILRFSF